MALQVRRHGRQRSQTASGTRAGEWQAQAPAGRGAPGHPCSQERLWHKALAPQVKRLCVGRMVAEHQMSERHACALVGLSRDTCRHVSQASTLNVQLSQEIVAVAHQRRR